jgi:hypothetical protein
MTTQDLKDNRDAIIAYINSNQYDLKFAMNLAVEFASSCESLDELYEQLEQFCKPVKSSKLATLMANAHADEQYNHQTKEWEKI